MRNTKTNNTKVGVLVLSGLIFMILTLYLIGKNRNLIGSTFTIGAIFSNVNGLVPGNNVRFKGLDVGTVKTIRLRSDTGIYVTMTIDSKMKQHIRTNAVASIGTDGIMGNKLININSAPGSAEPVRENDLIQAWVPIETEEMLRTLNTTNNNIERITENLYEMSVKLNTNRSLWALLSDTTLARDIKGSVTYLHSSTKNTAEMTAAARAVALSLEGGRGVAYQLFTDTTLSGQLDNSIRQIHKASLESSMMIQDLRTLISNVQEGNGPAGLILADTALRDNLSKTAKNLEQGTDRFNQNMEALKTNFLFRKYFRKLEKENAKQGSAKNE